jgi:hypothetical protein
VTGREIYSLTKLSFVKTRKAFVRNLSDQHCCLVLCLVRLMRQDLKRKLYGFLSSRFLINLKYVIGCNYYQPGRSQCRKCKKFVMFFDLLLPLWSIELISQFLDHFTDGMISSLQGLYLNTGQHKHGIKAYTHTHTHTHQISMSCVGFDPTIPASERAKTVHALDRSATVTGNLVIRIIIKSILLNEDIGGRTILKWILER